MKNFTLALSAAMLIGGTAIAAPAKQAPKRTPLKEVCSVMNLPAKAMASRAQANIINTPPAGTAALMGRNCDGFTIEGYEAMHGPILGSIARTVVTDNNEMYIGNPISEFPLETWIKGDIIGDTLSIRGAQAVYEEFDNDENKWYVAYVVPMEIVIENDRGTCVPAKDMRYDLVLGEDGSYTATDHNKMLAIATEMNLYDENGQPTGETTYVWAGYGDRDLVFYHDKGELVEVPADVPVQRWVWTDQYDEVGSLVDVLVDGDDIYIAGMDRSLPNAWVKGTIKDDKVYFPSGQFLGPDYEIMYFSYFCGAEFNYVTDPETGNEIAHATLADYAIFDYDPERPTLFVDNGYIINSTADELFCLYSYDLVEIDNQSRDIDSAPAAPYDLVYEEDEYMNEQKLWFQIPNVDVDGNMLAVEHLYYEIFVNGEVLEFNLEGIGETTRIPYTYEDYDIYVALQDHTVYLPEKVNGTIGARSIYVNEEGNDLYSTITTINANSGVYDAATAKEVLSVEWTDLSGRKIVRPATGIAIRTVTYTDGSVAHSKVRVK